MQQHAERNFPEEAGASDQEDLAILKSSVGDKVITLGLVNRE